MSHIFWGEPSGAGGKAWTIERRGANERSWPGGWTGGDGGPFSYTTCGNNCYGAQSRAHTWEANRSTEACIGQDYDDSYEVMETKDDRPPKMGAWLTFRIPGGTMHGNFDIILGPFPTVCSALVLGALPAPFAACNMLDVVPMLIGC